MSLRIAKWVLLSLLLPTAGFAATYTTQTATFNFLSTTGHTAITTWDATVGCPAAPLDDELSQLITLPFTFRYGTTNYTQVRVNINGRLQFNNTRCTAGTQAVGPPRTYVEPIANANLNNVIRIYGADLDLNAGGSITYGTSGTAPNRLFVVTWNNVPQWNAAGTSYNLQIQLAENGSFYFMYGVSNDISGGINVGPAQIAWQLTTADFVIVQNGLPANNTGWVFRFAPPRLTITKTSNVISDPINGTTNPKRIPGSFVEYSVTVTNSGVGAVDANTVAITDPVPANTDLYVSTASGPPVTFTNGTVVSGLAFAYPANVGYSNQVGGGVSYPYTPTANASGVDPAARGLRIAPTGTMAGATGAGDPSFTVKFRVLVR
jgi:uncharacterized repeat protein (TIGR01451 family)